MTHGQGQVAPNAISVSIYQNHLLFHTCLAPSTLCFEGNNRLSKSSLANEFPNFSTDRELDHKFICVHLLLLTVVYRQTLLARVTD